MVQIYKYIYISSRFIYTYIVRLIVICECDRMINCNLKLIVDCRLMENLSYRLQVDKFI